MSIVWVKAAFRSFFTAILWINLILCAIVGAVVGATGDYLMLGLFAGVIAGIFTNIVFGGLIATILNIDANLEKMVAGKEFGGHSTVPLTASARASAIAYDDAGPWLITSGQGREGVMSHQNRRHTYRVILTQPGKLSMKVTSNGEDGLPSWESYVNVLDANGAVISGSGRIEFPYNGEVDLKEAGTYYVEIKSSKAGRYYLTVLY